MERQGDLFLFLIYTPERFSSDWVDNKLSENGSVTFRRTFTFSTDALAEEDKSDFWQEDKRVFLLAIGDGGFFKVNKDILGLKYDLRLSKDMAITIKTFVAYRNISVFRRIDELVDEPIVIGGNAAGAIPVDDFEELLRNFPTSTELTHYAHARIARVLKDYMVTMSDAQIKLDNYINQKKTIGNRSKTDFIKDYESKKFEYVRDEISAMLQEVDARPDAFKEKDWQRQLVEFLLLIFPRYVTVLENVHIKDFYSTLGKGTDRYIDLLLVDANGSVDVIEVKRPRPYQLLSRRPGSRGNYTPSSELSEAVMQVEKYLFHLSKWGLAGERSIQEKRKAELPSDFVIKITNPKAMLILGRDNDFDDKQKLDFEIIKRKYANIIDIITYDDLLRRLDNIIAMIHYNFSKSGTGTKGRQA
jgi:hypothetical protein